MRVVRTQSLRETVEVIAALYQWWTFAPIEAHKSHVQASMKRGFTDHVGFLPPDPAVKILAQIEGVGREKAEALLKHFGSLERTIWALNAHKGQNWQMVPGIGPALHERAKGVFTKEFSKEIVHARSRKKKVHRSA